METSNDILSSTPPQVNQPQPPILPEKRNVNYWMISTLTLCLLVTLGGLFFYWNSKKGPITQNNNTSAVTTIPVSPTVVKSNQIRIAGLQLTYPESWVPIFSTPDNGKNIVYFAKSEEEALTLANCATQNSCNNFPLKLEDFANYAVWQNSTIEDFIKQVKSDIQLSNLQKTTVNGREAWLGFVDSQKTKHQAIIVTSTSQSKSFIAITASTTDATNGMLAEYIARLSSLKVNEYKSVKPGDLTLKKGFVAEISSLLVTTDSVTVNFILDSLLAPKNSTKNYNYLLYTESTKSSGSSIGGASYPKDSYLNSKYYLLTDNEQLINGEYGTPQVQIKLSSSPTKDLGLYLADPKYCQQDSDCQYRANFCTIGAFNPYHQFTTPWGCGPGDFEGLGNSMELQEKLGCQKDVEVKFDSLTCISNSCHAVNAKAVCKQ